MIALGDNTWEAPYGRDIPLDDAAGLAVFDGSGFAKTAITPQSGVRGFRVFTDAAIGDGDTFTLFRVDTSSQVYTWKTALTVPAVPGEVLLGASNTTALANAVSAAGSGGVPGTDYATGTEPCLDFEGASDGTTMTYTAVNFGDYANVALAAFTETAGSGSWAAATNGVDSVDFVQYQNNGATALPDTAPVSAQPLMRGGEWKIAPTAAQLTAKRYNGAIFDESEDATGDDTATSVWLRRQYMVVLTDHPLAGKPNGATYAGILDDPTDLATDGSTIEIPNEAHADFKDWVGNTRVGVPDDPTDVITGYWILVENPYTGDRAVAEIKSYDSTGGTGNQGLITLVVGGEIRIPLILRAASILWYTVYESNVGLVAELGTQAKLDAAIAVWDRVLTGATHNVANSAGRRLRDLQEFGVYEGGAVWIDTTNGSGGTTDFENGTAFNPVDSIADANTIAASIGLSKFEMDTSTITLAATQANQVFRGENWTLALGGQNIGGTHFRGATISGISTGAAHYDHCSLDICTFAGGEFTDCGLKDTITLSGAVTYTFINCFHAEAGSSSTIDFGAAVGATEVHIHNWHGALLILNMQAGDILHFTSPDGYLTLDSTCTGGTLNHSGVHALTDNSSGMTINERGNVYVVAAAIKVITDQFLFTVANLVDSNAKAISDDTVAADRLEALMDSVLPIAVNDASATATAFAADGFTEAVDNIFNGRLITFLDGANQFEQTDISGYDAAGGAQGAQEFTVTALTSAPADDVNAIIH